VPVRLLLLGDLQDPVCSTRNNALDVGQHGDPESRDPAYSMGHQKLIKAAIEHGLIKYDHAEPTLA
jgi:hypothetical protein